MRLFATPKSLALPLGDPRSLSLHPHPRSPRRLHRCGRVGISRNWVLKWGWMVCAVLLDSSTRQTSVRRHPAAGSTESWAVRLPSTIPSHLGVPMRTGLWGPWSPSLAIRHLPQARPGVRLGVRDFWGLNGLRGSPEGAALGCAAAACRGRARGLFDSPQAGSQEALPPCGLPRLVSFEES